MITGSAGCYVAPPAQGRSAKKAGCPSLARVAAHADLLTARSTSHLRDGYEWSLETTLRGCFQLSCWIVRVSSGGGAQAQDFHLSAAEVTKQNANCGDALKTKRWLVGTTHPDPQVELQVYKILDLLIAYVT